MKVQKLSHQLNQRTAKRRAEGAASLTSSRSLCDESSISTNLFVVTAIAGNYPELICPVAEKVRTNYLMEKN